MKLFSEEITALKTGINKSKALLLFILLPEIILPQIPFKGFCKLNSFPVDSGYSKIFSFNYNLDEHSDLLVFNPFQKSALIYEGANGLRFNPKNKINLPIEISNIKPIILKNNMIENFAFASRKQKCFGIYNFNNLGNPSLVYSINFNSYPENISISNNLLMDDHEFLISGNSFDGLSIIKILDNQLTEKKIYNKSVFQNAEFIDFNTDGIEDIIALSSINNSLHMLFRNSKNEFEDLRQIRFAEKILSVQVFDINYDYFKDVIVSTDKKIKIIFGDSNSAYDNTVSISTMYNADKFVYGDFNRDGFFDINYINTENGIISTIFAKDFYSFYSELLHKQEKHIVDVIPFFSKFIYGTAYLNNNGKIEILSKVTSLSDEQNLAVSLKPDLIATFDYLSNGINDIVFTDLFNNTLSFITRDAAGLPDKYSAIKLFENHKNMIEFSKSKTRKYFYLFSYDKKVIELLDVDFDNYTHKRSFIYTDGLIQDISIKADENDEPELYIIYSKNKNLNLQSLKKVDQKEQKYFYRNVSNNWISPFFVSLEVPAIGFWAKDKVSYNLLYVSFKDGKYISESKYKTKTLFKNLIAKSENLPGRSIFNNVSILSGDVQFDFVCSNSNNKLIAQTTTSNFRITDKNQLFFGKNNSIFINENYNKSLSELMLDKENKIAQVKKIYSNIDVNRYIIQNFDQRNQHLVFTNFSDGLIEIRQLPK